MTFVALARHSLRHYWRTHLAVAVGVATAVAVLAGALLVGGSVRSSLADLASGRLGRTAVVVASEMPFSRDLADRLSPVVSRVSAAAEATSLFALQGGLRHQESDRRAARVQVYGVDQRFFAFHGVAPVALSEDDIWLSPDLAGELHAAPGDDVILRVPRPTDIPLDSLHGRRDDAGRSVRLSVRGTLPREQLGEFSLTPSQGPVRAAFVAIERLQRDLDVGDRANMLLVGPAAAALTEDRIRTALGEVLTPPDVGLRFDALPDGAIAVEAAAGLIGDASAEAVRQHARASAFDAVPMLTWLANRLTVGPRAVPYSLVTAIDLGRVVTVPPAPATAPPPIVLNDWAARELGARAGDALEMEYYRWADRGALVTERATFRVAGVVPISGLAGDRRLAPDYPGITDTRSLGDWDPPFPIDLRQIRPADEKYWDDYGTTPKAFIPLEAGQELWATRHGRVTGVRIVPSAAGGTPPASQLAVFASAVTRAIDPVAAGFGVVDVRTQNLSASVGATDFGAYFSYFSFFLVVAALLVALMFFRLNIEQRYREIGILRAMGFPLAAVRRLALIEGVVVAIAGAVAGAMLAIGWAAFMMYGLRTWWIGAVGTAALRLHVDAAPLAAGALGGLAAALVAIAWSFRVLRHWTPRALMAGAGAGERLRPRRRTTIALEVAAAGLAAALVAAASAGLVPAAGAFFGAGALILVAGLRLMARRLRQPPARRATSVARLGMQNMRWRPGRSLAASGLVAAAVFLLVSVDAFRRDASGATAAPASTGGFALIGETSVPILDDPSSPAGLNALGIGADAGDPDLAGVRLVGARLRDGDDASCLNMYPPARPRLLGVSPAVMERTSFQFRASVPAAGQSPWRLLDAGTTEDVVPAIADATSLQYVLHAAVGDTITIDADTAQPIRLRIVASLSDSVLQGEIVIGESAFARLFPSVAGYRVLFVGVEPPTAARQDAAARALESRLGAFGLDVESSAGRLAGFHRVENTYISTFQTLGGLGLILGCLGLSAIVARNVLERRRELSVLGATGYTGRDLQRLVLVEQIALVLSGVVIGLVAAVIAIAPVMIERGTLPRLPILWILAVTISGVATALGATRIVRRLPLVAGLRAE